MALSVPDTQTRYILGGATLATPENFIQPAVRWYKTTGRLWWKKHWYLLAEDYAVIWESAPGVEKLILKRGPYDFDKSSTPKWAAWFGHTPYGPSEAASLFHDVGYEKEGEDRDGRFEYWIRIDGGPWQRDISKWSRADLDELYRQLCVWGGMSEAKARIQWTAVRVYPPNMLKRF